VKSHGNAFRRCVYIFSFSGLSGVDFTRRVAFNTLLLNAEDLIRSLARIFFTIFFSSLKISENKIKSRVGTSNKKSEDSACGVLSVLAKSSSSDCPTQQLAKSAIVC
jgi:hypothetical protein